MKCKFCESKLPEGGFICPNCGGDNDDMQMPELTMDEEGKPELTEEVPAKKKPKIWVIILAAVAGVLLLGVLVIAVLYGAGVNVFGPAKATYDVQYKDTYTITDEAESKNAADTVVAVAGGVELTNSELQVYYWQTVTDYISNYYSYLSYFGLDTSLPLDKQVYNEETGITWQQFFLDNAIQSWHRYTVLNLKAEEEGFTLDQESQEYLDSIPAEMETMAAYYGHADANAMLAKDVSPVCDMEGYMRYVRANLKGMEYFESIFDAINPTMQEIEEYYAANEAQFVMEGVIKADGNKLVDVRHVLLSPDEEVLDAEGNASYDENGYPMYTDASWEVCRGKAQSLLDNWLAEDATEDGFAKMATDNTEDPGSAATGGLYTQVASGDMVPAFDAWCFDASRKPGDSGLVKTEYGYHIMYFVGSEEVWISNAREKLMSERAAAIVEAGLARWPIVVDYKKVVIGDSAE